MVNRYLVLEIGDSAYTEFKMKNGDYEETCDAILVDEIEAESENEAHDKIFLMEEHKHKHFDNLIVRRVI